MYKGYRKAFGRWFCKDSLGQLVKEDTTTYAYDTRGNRIEMIKDGIVTEYRYDRTNKLMTENTDNVWTAYAYDKNGAKPGGRFYCFDEI